jgi:hypothetical protein
MFRTGSNRQSVPTLMYVRHRVFEMGGSRQPVLNKEVQAQIHTFLIRN